MYGMMTVAFQSTPPHGRRQLRLRIFYDPKTVSIHASAREATRQTGLASGFG